MTVWPFAPLKPLRYGVVYADPPWAFQPWGKSAAPTRAAERHYPTMSMRTIRALPVPDLLRDDGALFLWVLDSMLDQAIGLIGHWGLRYKKVAFVWVKESRHAVGKPVAGTGLWTRNGAEFCLMATIGSPRRLARDVAQVVWAPRRQHSRKPDEVPARIMRLVRGPYCEIFARQSRPGWDVWGNEIGRFSQ